MALTPLAERGSLSPRLRGNNAAAEATAASIYVIRAGWRQTSQQLVEGDRQIPHAFTGRVIDRIGDSRRSTNDADLTDALGA